MCEPVRELSRRPGRFPWPPARSAGFLLHLLLALTAHVWAEPAAPEAYGQSQWWPPYVVYRGSEPIDASRSQVGSGTLGTLVRMDPDGRLVVDFGREGVARIDPALTDFAEGLDALRRDPESKAFGNALLMIGPRLLSIAGDRLVTVDLERLRETSAILILYATLDESSASELVVLLEKWQDALREQRVAVVLLDRGGRPDNELGALLMAHGLRLTFMRARLVASYAESLSHGVEKPFGAVMIDHDGKVLGRGEAESVGALPLGDLIEVR